jgi:hypothetical protein
VELELLEKLNSFYSGAFSQLVTYTVGLIALLGVVTPLVIQFFQRRSNQSVQDAMMTHIQDSIECGIKQLEDKYIQIKDRLELVISEKITIHSNEEAKIYSQLDGKIYHLQGLLNINEKNYALATTSFILAAGNYIKCGDDFGISRMLRLITDQCAGKLKQSDFENEIVGLTEKIDSFFELVSSQCDGRYGDQLVLLKAALAKAKKRTEPDASR